MLVEARSQTGKITRVAQLPRGVVIRNRASEESKRSEAGKRVWQQVAIVPQQVGNYEPLFAT